MKQKFILICDYGIELGLYCTLFFFVQFPIYPLYYQSFGTSISVFFWIIKSLLEHRLVYKHYSWNIWILIFNVFIWLSLLWSINVNQPVWFSLVFTTGSISMIIFSSCFNKKSQVIRILCLLFLFGSYFAFNILRQNIDTMLRITNSYLSLKEALVFRKLVFDRVISSMGGTNSTGGLFALPVALLLPILIYGFRTNKSMRNGKNFIWTTFVWKLILQIIGYISLILLVIVVLMSGSRGAMLGLVFSLLLIFMIGNRWFTNLIFGQVLVLASIIPFTRLLLSNTYANIVDESRFVIWFNSIEIIKLVPFTGIGLRNFPIAYQYFFNENYNHAHNIFLNIAIELGIPGLILFVALAFSLIYYGIIYAKRQKDPFFYAVNVGFVSLVFGFLVRCLVDYTI